MELSFPSRFLNSFSSSSTAARTAPLINKPIVPHRFPFTPLLPFQRSLSPFTFKQMNNINSQSPLSCSSLPQNNGSSSPTSPSPDPGRIGVVERVTKETNVWVKISLDGNGVANSSTSIPFLDHMLDQLASHGLFDVHVKATGDIHIDDHHTNEDVALALGTALLQALGDRKGINRFGDFSAPLDEALIHVSLDLSGRPHLSYDLNIPTERVGTYDTQLVEHFFQSLVNTSGMTLHIRQLAGKNSHHIIEATFKAFARALRQATEYDLRRLGTVPSSKGVLSRS
ncbi:Imidazoleglycerol-phosphate dehydratase [Hibiscus syriacus]|uniref:Imidazoleglycerol-phosphate dehydratase n=1 Tax=Hibiscus syriacus TaxID=106335 RepID=A0A6A2Z9U0_HIBSY|nr:imidazoleglycerol-phosphate dehydratase 1, chloroplastic-like [Hibiscus syriacus]KAE8687875.1 Imidazoleglycerol-phosphate dehydratase [Hibiscus syriacus]